MRSLRGFTLVEIVVALTLVSLIMLGLLGALRGLGDSSARVSQVSDRVADMRLISDFLRRAFAAAEPLAQVPPENSAVPATPFFRGDPDAVVWVGDFPARFGTRGLHFMRLRLIPDASGLALALDYLPYSGPHGAPDWTHSRTHLLVGSVDSFSLAYQEDAPGASWEQKWNSEQLIPGRMKVSVQASGRYWPELIYRLRSP